MIQLTPQMRLLVAMAPVDFRCPCGKRSCSRRRRVKCWARTLAAGYRIVVELGCDRRRCYHRAHGRWRSWRRRAQPGPVVSLAKFAVLSGRWPSDPTVGIGFQREPPRDPAVLSTHEVALFFRALERVSRSEDLARDRAMLALLFTLGLRVHELVALDVDQVDAVSATLVAVQGKGATVHDLPVESSTLALVAEWIARRSERSSPGERGLFLSRRGTRLSTRAAQLLFRKLRITVGTAKKVTPHTARHSAATLALVAGADVASIGELLRHGDINTTRLYLRLSGERKRQVVRILANVIPAELRVVTPAPTGELSRLDALNTAPIGRSTAANDNANPVDAHCRLGERNR